MPAAAPSRLSGLDVARALVILAGAFMVVLDFFIVLVALPLLVLTAVRPQDRRPARAVPEAGR